MDVAVSDGERTKRKEILDKRTAKDLQQRWEQQDRAEIEYQEESLAPPVITEARCRVCNSDYRLYIERQLIKGYSYQAIANSIPPDSEGKSIDRRSISRHFQKHMRIDHAVVRAELEEEAKLLRQNYEEGVKGALTDRGVLKVLVRKAYEDALNGVTTVEPRDLIQMVKLNNEMETGAAAIKNEETEAALRIFMRAIQNVCSKEMQMAIGNEVKRLREIDDIEYEMEENLQMRKQLPEAEVVDEVPNPD